MSWLQILGGRRFDLTDPRAEDVDFHVMARILARTPRFNGHTERGVYSVAQHLVEGARAIERDTGDSDAAFAYLLHDGHEYLIGDIATPVAQALAWWGGSAASGAIKCLKASVDRAIYSAAGLGWPLPRGVRDVVREYDLRMCRTERDARMAPPPERWADAIERAEPVRGCDLSPWSEDYAAGAFVLTFNKYRNRVKLRETAEVGT